MPVTMIGGCLAIVHLELRPEEIPPLLERHACKFAGAPKLEECGQRLIAADFPAEASAAFVKAVCDWGQGQRNASRVIEFNAEREISQALREGLALALDGQVSAGVERIGYLKHLGQSFASKQLRFLAPERAVILDEVIRSRIGYRETKAGYDQFLGEVTELLREIQSSASLVPEFRHRLRVCDIEAAIYAKLQGY